MADIELVIKIPEELKNKIDNANEGNYKTYLWWFETTLYCAIKDGTILPEGHGDLIDVNREITVPIYDEEYEEWGEKTLTVREALNRWSDEGVTVKDVVVLANKTESEEV